MTNTLKAAVARFWPGGGGAASAPNAQASTPFEWPALLRGLMPLVLLATVITAVVLMFAWRDQSSFKPLFGAREKVAAADMMTVLDGAAIPYRIHPDTGQVLVPGDRLGEVRMLLASKGVVAQLPPASSSWIAAIRSASASSCRTCASVAASKASSLRAS